MKFVVFFIDEILNFWCSQLGLSLQQPGSPVRHPLLHMCSAEALGCRWSFIHSASKEIIFHYVYNSRYSLLTFDFQPLRTGYWHAAWRHFWCCCWYYCISVRMICSKKFVVPQIEHSYWKTLVLLLPIFVNSFSLLVSWLMAVVTFDGIGMFLRIEILQPSFTKLDL